LTFFLKDVNSQKTPAGLKPAATNIPLAKANGNEIRSAAAD